MKPITASAGELAAGESRSRGAVVAFAAGYAAVVAGCWAWIVAMARDMYGPMSGAAAWMLTGAWDLRHAPLLFAMWVAMMAGMMLPSFGPALASFVRAEGQTRSDRSTAERACALSAGYTLVWIGFALGATGFQLLLAHSLLLSPMMEIRDERLRGLILVVAGLYQLTPFKQVFLESCRCSSRLATPDIRGGASDCLESGLSQGRRCAGCCWALMLLLFVGGVMNLWLNAAITIVVLYEKLGPAGRRVSQAVGLCIAAAGVWCLLTRS